MGCGGRMDGKQSRRQGSFSVCILPLLVWHMIWRSADDLSHRTSLSPQVVNYSNHLLWILFLENILYTSSNHALITGRSWARTKSNQKRRHSSDDIGMGVIPSALRSIISGHHSEDTLTTPDYAYGDGSTATQRYRSNRLWETVLDLWIEADCCANPTDDENAWSHLVDCILRLSVSGSELLKVRSL